ncbi:MAG: hypothetical protein EOP83_12290 [Verrucomicrobiaceae bacterium]|nr:MAG: hypothetical protein EOP83_12290 [Verrucomicrobiaceae bacterium]
MKRIISRPFMLFALISFGSIILAMVAVVGYCLYLGDIKGAIGWTICTVLVALPARMDPAILWKKRMEDDA